MKLNTVAAVTVHLAAAVLDNGDHSTKSTSFIKYVNMLYKVLVVPRRLLPWVN